MLNKFLCDQALKKANKNSEGLLWRYNPDPFPYQGLTSNRPDSFDPEISIIDQTSSQFKKLEIVGRRSKKSIWEGGVKRFGCRQLCYNFAFLWSIRC